MKSIIICADDYGQNQAISKGIIDLIDHGCLTATSCMTNFKHWPKYAGLLKPCVEEIDIGLHFNLTKGTPLTSMQLTQYKSKYPNIVSLVVKTHRGTIIADEIEKELNAQLDQFIEHIGRLPDYIDGHQHIHQLPIIRHVLIKVHKQRFSNHSYIRIPHDKKHRIGFPKNWIITKIGATKLKELCKTNNITHNITFTGTYNFKQAKHYRRFCQTFIERLENNGILMCHPGLPSNDKSDPIYFSRPYEYNYLLSESFKEDLARANARPAKFIY